MSEEDKYKRFTEFKQSPAVAAIRDYMERSYGKQPEQEAPTDGAGSSVGSVKPRLD